MDRAEYLNAVSEFFYQGEVLGEAYCVQCVALEEEPARRYKWATIMQLETETKALLRPFLLRLGLGVAQADMSEKVGGIAASYHATPWRQHMGSLADITSFYLDRFREIDAAAPDSERGISRYMLDHEAAIHDFARREMTGDTRGSLAGIVAQLRWPLPAPDGY